MGAGVRVEITLVEGDAMKAIVAGYRLKVFFEHLQDTDRKSTRLNSSHESEKI